MSAKPAGRGEHRQSRHGPAPVALTDPEISQQRAAVESFLRNNGRWTGLDRERYGDEPGLPGNRMRPSVVAEYRAQIQAMRGGSMIDVGEDKKSAAAEYSLKWWLERDIAAPDFILGDWLSTTSRALFVAPTGLGKTHIMMALAGAVATGRDRFLHWDVRRPAKVLYLDGEMSRRLVKSRLADAARRLGSDGGNLFVLCREDFPELEPLNTEAGQDFVEAKIKAFGGVDLIVFDSVMSLIAGDMKDEEPWQQTLPWIKRLTGRSIGQIWVHHTGHNESYSYGTKTREWQLDTVVLLESADRPGADIAFTLKFTKARERAPHNRGDFEPAVVTLKGDHWLSDRVSAPKALKSPSPKAKAFHDALIDALGAGGAVRTQSAGLPSVTVKAWKAECRRKGLLDPTKQKSESALFSKYRRELVALKWAICNAEYVWTGMVAR